MIESEKESNLRKDEISKTNANTDDVEVRIKWDQVLRLKDSVEIRKEEGGGLVWDGDNDAIYAIDETAYAILTTGQGMTFRKILDCFYKKYPGIGHKTIKEDFGQLIKKTANFRIED